MNLWDRITGADMTRDWAAMDARVAALAQDYRHAWGQVKGQFLRRSDLTGRNLTPIYEGVVGLFESSAADGREASEVLGDDIPAFCDALADVEGAPDWHAKARQRLNDTVARRLRELGE